MESSSTTSSATAVSDKNILSFSFDEHARARTRCSVQEAEAGAGLLQTAPTSLARRTNECHGKQGFAVDGRLCCREGVLADPPKLIRGGSAVLFVLVACGGGEYACFSVRGVLADVPMLFQPCR